MRFQTFRLINPPREDIFLLVGESKRRIYIAMWDKSGKVTDFDRYPAFDDKEYFLLYGDRRDIK